MITTAAHCWSPAVKSLAEKAEEDEEQSVKKSKGNTVSACIFPPVLMIGSKDLTIFHTIHEKSNCSQFDFLKMKMK